MGDCRSGANLLTVVGCDGAISRMPENITSRRSAANGDSLIAFKALINAQRLRRPRGFRLQRNKEEGAVCSTLGESQFISWASLHYGFPEWGRYEQMAIDPIVHLITHGIELGPRGLQVQVPDANAISLRNLVFGFLGRAYFTCFPTGRERCRDGQQTIVEKKLSLPRSGTKMLK
jgi:hypothetical protein